MFSGGYIVIVATSWLPTKACVGPSCPPTWNPQRVHLKEHRLPGPRNVRIHVGGQGKFTFRG